MPTFVAIIAASVAGYLVSRFLGNVSAIWSAVISFLLWILVFYFTKRFLTQIKP
jgi:hypothetical protein